MTKTMSMSIFQASGGGVFPYCQRLVSLAPYAFQKTASAIWCRSFFTQCSGPRHDRKPRAREGDSDGEVREKMPIPEPHWRAGCMTGVILESASVDCESTGWTSVSRLGVTRR